MSEKEKDTAAEPSIRLGGWSFYFLAKFLLFWKELIGLHPLENLAFAAFLLAPIKSAKWRLLRSLVAIPVALALLYYDSWLPPLARVWSQTNLLSNFSADYVIELSGRFISWPVIALLTIAWAVFHIVQRRLRVGLLIVAALFGLAIPPLRDMSAVSAAPPSATAEAQAKTSGTAKDLDLVLKDFYAGEAPRSIKFIKPAENVPAFDVIFLHICSLSWDDLQATGLDKHPLWQHLDYVFRHFNSAASYSGPAAIRINRAPCGQTAHEKLYSSVPDNCYLMPSLKQAGFSPSLAMNHDGHFDDFLQLVRAQGLDAPLMNVNGIPIPLRAFDNSPIYDDLAVLSRWFDTRQKSDASRVAMYYNTISLHDGNRIVDGPNSKLSSSDTYKIRLAKLLSDLDAFMQQIERSGRRAVVVVIPEHGAAIRGDKMQIAGLREIATPKITTVPVGIKVIGPDVKKQGESVQIDESTSYLAVSYLIGQMLEKSPYGESGFAPSSYLAGLPATDYVAENESGAIVRRDNKYFLRLGKEPWREYPSE